MGWYGPRGACGCCDPGCEPCAEITFFTIDITDPICPGIADPDPGFCSRNNGTYVFRTTGSPAGDGCSWSQVIAAGQCFNDPVEPYFLWYIGTLPISQGGCGGAGNYVFIAFSPDPGGVKITVTIERDYTHKTGSGPTINSGKYYFKFEDVFATCAAAVGATLPYAGVSVSNCTGTAPGDYCDVASAVVTIG